ncbi:MAG: ABC transporter substrate-binding protein [Verrucomicrobiota bacterium JB024]|nr:ABC transporter substrate-binding protein [Verrucomicrobiota bacterium JB024]
MDTFRHPPRRRRILALAFGLTAFFVASCSRPTPPTLKVGINHWPGYEFLFLADEKQYFEQEGVRVQLVEFTSLPDVLEAYKSGDVDAMACTMIETVLAADQSKRQPQVILVTDASNGADVILAREPLQDPSQLAGLRIACECAHLGGYMLHRALSRHGLDFEDVQIRNIDQMAMEKAFKQGEVDALVTYPPVSTRLIRDVHAHVVFTSADIPREILDVLVADKTVIDTQPESVRALLRAWARAHNFHINNPQEAHRIMGNHMGLTPEEFAQSLDGVDLVRPSNQVIYFGPQGRLPEIARLTHQTLRQMGVVQHDLPTYSFVAPASLFAQP